jgi:hypothetical protein
MKIKTLAIAAATLAVGAISSQAQSPVYSQNVVGYVNVIYPAGAMVLSANPLTTGHDVLTNVLQGVPGASHLFYWTGSTWTTYTYSAVTHKWLSGAVDVSNTNLAPGIGFFLNASSAYTNTYSGTIVANTGGGTATNALVTGLHPTGSLLPYGDVITNASTFNMTVGGASTIQIWNITNQTFDTPYTYSAVQHQWKQGAVTNNPTINVGQGFFISPNVATNWVQTLQ